MEKIVIFDIDGTLCTISEERQKLIETKDWDQFHRLGEYEKVIEPVRLLLYLFKEEATIVISTGRPDRYRMMTTSWLRDNGIQYNVLAMRPNHDFRPSYEVKERIADYYNTVDTEIIAVEDRQQDIDMYLSKGFTVIKIKGGQIESKCFS